MYYTKYLMGHTYEQNDTVFRIKTTDNNDSL